MNRAYLRLNSKVFYFVMGTMTLSLAALVALVVVKLISGFIYPDQSEHMALMIKCATAEGVPITAHVGTSEVTLCLNRSAIIDTEEAQ